MDEEVAATLSMPAGWYQSGVPQVDNRGTETTVCISLTPTFVLVNKSQLPSPSPSVNPNSLLGPNSTPSPGPSPGPSPDPAPGPTQGQSGQSWPQTPGMTYCVGSGGGVGDIYIGV